MGYIILGIVVLVIISLVGFVIGTYNKLVVLRNKVEDQWAQVEVVLKRRADLIPNLVETVKGYAKHEGETLEKVIQARNNTLNAASPEELKKAEGELSNVLSRLMVLTENYPDLKANANFTELQRDLKDTEDKITFARQFYNDTVLMYQNKREMFPSNIIAGVFNFEHISFFEATEADRVVPNVKF